MTTDQLTSDVHFLNVAIVVGLAYCGWMFGGQSRRNKDQQALNERFKKMLDRTNGVKQYSVGRLGPVSVPPGPHNQKFEEDVDAMHRLLLDYYEYRNSKNFMLADHTLRGLSSLIGQHITYMAEKKDLWETQRERVFVDTSRPVNG